MKYHAVILLFWGFLLTQLAIAQEVVLDSKSLLIKQNPAFMAYLRGDGRFVALDTYRFGFVRRHRFFVGDVLAFKLNKQKGTWQQKMTAVSDTSFTFSTFNDISNEFIHTEIPLQTVQKIHITRRIPWVSQGATALPIAGVLFLAGDTFVMDNGEFRVQFDPKSALIGAGIASLGVLCWKLSHPSYRLGKRHRLHVLRVR
jgi:hypothetical protein